MFPSLADGEPGVTRECSVPHNHFPVFLPSSCQLALPRGSTPATPSKLCFAYSYRVMVFLACVTSELQFSNLAESENHQIPQVRLEILVQWSRVWPFSPSP